MYVIEQVFNKTKSLELMQHMVTAFLMLLLIFTAVCFINYTLWYKAFFCSADEDIDSTFPANVVLSSDGNCLWVPPGLFLSTCKIDITWFPFDDQKCDMKFGSWTYDGSGLNLILDGEGGDASNFIANGEWELIGMYRVLCTLFMMT